MDPDVLDHGADEMDVQDNRAPEAVGKFVFSNWMALWSLVLMLAAAYGGYQVAWAANGWQHEALIKRADTNAGNIQALDTRLKTVETALIELTVDVKWIRLEMEKKK